ncbi:hypothetical protein FRC09_011444 [Ceratobasidium sp. 395]|nr:hypothetical protein FRC09_011444 [Ceratobasidium sp. 395]
MSDSDTLNQPMWVGAFSSPSLVNLLIADGDLWDASIVSYNAASFMTKSLAARHPKLERLELFPSPVADYHVDEGESTLLAFLSGDPFYEYAAHFTSLKHLSCTFAWFEGPALQILGQLPRLEIIDVSGVDDRLETMSPELSKDSFPSLRSLCLHLPYPSDASKTLMITQMVKGLTSLRILLNMEEVTSGINNRPSLMGQFFPLLLNAPHVTDLWINADANGELKDEIEIDGSALEIFRHLPLKSLHLGQIYLSDEALQLDLALVWPSISRLSIPKHPTSLIQLSLFAMLPELRHLELQLMDHDEFKLEYGGTASGLTVLQAGPNSEFCWNPQRVDRIRR